MKLTTRKRAVVSSVLTLGITFGMVMILLGCYLLLGVCNNKLLEKDLKNSNYYSKVSEKILQEVEEILADSSLTAAAVEDTISEEKIYAYCNNYIQTRLSGMESQFDPEKFQESVTNNIQTYLEQNQISVQDNNQEYIEILSDAITQVCEDNITLGFINYYLKFQNVYQKWGYILIIIGGILVICMVLGLFKLYHHKYKALKFVISGMIGSILLASLHYIYIKTHSWVLDNLDFLTDYYMDFIYQFYYDCRVRMLPVIGCAIVITFLLAILMQYLRKRK